MHTHADEQVFLSVFGGLVSFVFDDDGRAVAGGDAKLPAMFESPAKAMETLVLGHSEKELMVLAGFWRRLAFSGRQNVRNLRGDVLNASRVGGGSAGSNEES